jgi:hypothetical protein
MATSKRSGSRRKSPTKTQGKRPANPKKKTAARRPAKAKKTAAKRPPIAKTKSARVARPRKAAPSSKSSLKRKTVARPAAPKVSTAAPRRKTARKPPRPELHLVQAPPIIESPEVADAFFEPTLPMAFDDAAAIHEAPTLEMAPIETDVPAEPVAMAVDDFFAAHPPEVEESLEEGHTEPLPPGERLPD